MKWDDANLLLPNFYVLPALSSRLLVFSKFCIMNNLLRFLLLLFQSCLSLRNVSFGDRILGKSNVIITVGWIWWRHQRAPFLVLPRAPATLNPPLVAGLSFPLETTDQAFRRRNNGKNLILTAVQLSCIKADCDESKVHIKSAFCAKLKRNKCVMTERPVCGRRLLGLTFVVAFWTFPRWCTAQCCSNAGWNRRLVRNSMTCFCKWA